MISDDEQPSRVPAVSRRTLLQGAGEAALAASLTVAGRAQADTASSEPRALSARRFEGRVALITGGARGQGRAHAVRLAREGASVVLCDILEQIPTVEYPLASQADMDETVRLIRAAGGRCLAIKADVRNPHAAADAVGRTIKEFGKLDILLANAGILGSAPLKELSDQGFEDIVSTNLFGVFNFMRSAIPPMEARHSGRIVVTASQAGRMGFAQGAHYAASKWGAIGLVKSAALELAKSGITVNAVCPTSVNTPMVNNPTAWRRLLAGDPAPTREKFEAKMHEHPMLPQGVPWVEPDDVSDAVLFLASDAAQHITGSVIDIQAGAAASNIA
jgi:SDR family mycofactocin-dependent oxidoreductase